ncbi:MAG: LacI family transcriptional regulator [Rhodothermales bacterium]|jgi:LacI family transcriptional regulator
MKNIAVVMELEWPLRRHHDVYAGIQAYADEHHAEDWTLALDNFPQAVLTGEMAGPRYDGVIGRLSLDLQEILVKRQIPAANAWMASSRGKAPSVIPDLAASAQMAIDHFASRGIRRVAHVGYRNDVAVQIEAMAFKAAARENGFPCTVHKCNDGAERDIERWRAFNRQVTSWLKRWEAPIGVLVHYDEVCRQICVLAERAGWVVPDQLSLIGSGNNTIICESVAPSLSSIHHAYHRNGYEAARLLDIQLNGGELPKGPVLVMPVEIATRRSTDVFAVPDPMVSAALRYMAEHCEGPISVDLVAAAVNAGRRTLERRFRSILGRSITHELNRLRIERMKRLLVETDDPVKVLVGKAGFGSPEQMRLVFRQFTGRRPVEYREQHRAPNSGAVNEYR